MSEAANCNEKLIDRSIIAETSIYHISVHVCTALAKLNMIHTQSPR